MIAGLSVRPSASSSCADAIRLSAFGSTKSSALPVDSSPVTGVPSASATTKKTNAATSMRRGCVVTARASRLSMRGGGSAARSSPLDPRLRDAALELVQAVRVDRPERPRAEQPAARGAHGAPGEHLGGEVVRARPLQPDRGKRAAVVSIARRTPGTRVASDVIPETTCSGRDAGPNQPSQTPTSRSGGCTRGSANCSLAPTETAGRPSKSRTSRAVRSSTTRPSRNAYAGSASIPAAVARVPPLNCPAASPVTK